MRDKSKKRDPAKEKKALIKQYEISNDSNKRRISAELKQYSKKVQELNGAVKGINKKTYTDLCDKATEIAEECYNIRARIMWHLNVVDTNYRNYTALIEADSLKRALKLRCDAGKYRASAMEDLSKNEAKEKAALAELSNAAEQAANSNQKRGKR